MWAKDQACDPTMTNALSAMWGIEKPDLGEIGI